MAPSKVRKKVASSKQFIATRDRRDTPNAKNFFVEAVRYLGTIRWVPSLLNNLAPADAERRNPRWSPGPSGVLFCGWEVPAWGGDA